MQFTYYNNTKKHVSVYKGTLQEYVGYIEPDALISFWFEIPKGKGIFIKHFDTGMVMITTMDLQDGSTDIDKPTSNPYQFCQAGEP